MVSFDEKLQILDTNYHKTITMGDTKFNVNVNVSCSLEYLHVLQSNAFLNLITVPTRVTPTSRTVIDHILTNDNESIITPKQSCPEHKIFVPILFRS